MAKRLGAAVYGEMLRSRDGLEMVRIAALHPLYKRHSHARRQIGVFPVRLLPATPAGIAENVDIRRPEGEPVIAAVIAVAYRFVVLRAGLGRDRIRNAVHQVRVPSGGQA